MTQSKRGRRAWGSFSFVSAEDEWLLVVVVPLMVLGEVVVGLATYSSSLVFH